MLTASRMRFLIICFYLMFLYGINADDENDLEKAKDEKIKSVVAQVNSRVKRTRDNNGFLFKLVDLLFSKLKKVRADIEKLKIGKAGIGFTATTVGTNQYVKVNQPIPFSRMISDYGGSFKIVNGKFVCQIDGLYHFTASVCIVNSDVWVRIIKNGKEIGYMYKDFDGFWGAGTGSTIVRLSKGDKLYLIPNRNVRIWQNVTIISGFRISA